MKIAILVCLMLTLTALAAIGGRMYGETFTPPAIRPLPQTISAPRLCPDGTRVRVRSFCL